MKRGKEISSQTYHPIYTKFKHERKAQLIAAYPYLNVVHAIMLFVLIVVERIWINSLYLLLFELVCAVWLASMWFTRWKKLALFKKHINILYGFEVFLISVLVCVYSFSVLYLKQPPVWHTGSILFLMLVVSAEFLPAYSLRHLIPLCIGLPLFAWYAIGYFLLEPALSTILLALFPLAAWVIGSLTSILIERVYYREFRMRYLAERRREKVKEELARYESLNKKLEETKKSLEKEIEERINIEKKLEQFAAFDDLTSVYNRRAGLELLKEALHYARRKQQALTIAFVDVDKLKIVNDNFGHQAGDNYLKEVVNLLRQHLRKSDSVSRFGGDEFLIVLTECKREEAEAIFNRIEDDMDKINKRERIYPLSFSYGIAESSLSGDENVHQLIATADERMYVNKQQKKWS